MKKLSVILAAVLLLFSCKKESGEQEKLTVYVGLQEDLAALVTQKFQEKSGIPTEYINLSSGETLARLKAERSNMSASVWYGGPVDGMIAAIDEGLIEPYLSPEAQNIKAEYKDDKGFWTGIYVGYLGFVANKKTLAEKGLKMPSSWADLLKEEFTGEIVVAHPGSSGTAYTMLASLVQMMGEEKAMEYLKKLNSQVRQYTKSGKAPGRMVGMGEALLGITFLHDGIKYQKEGFKDIIVGAPAEGTGYEIGGVVLLKNAPNPEGAKKFIDFVLTAEAQDLGKVTGSYHFLTNVGGTNPEEAREIEGTKLIDYDFDWAGKNKKRLVDVFTKETNAEQPKN